MAQPEFVPARDGDRVRVSERPPPPAAWAPDRPGDVKDSGGQAAGAWFGSAGPDQGYALRLARLMRDQLTVTAGEHLDDAVAGCVEVATRRAALFGRAPVGADLEVAFLLWGFVGAAPQSELVAFRRVLFARAGHHYGQRREIVDHVPETSLRLSPADIRARATGDWRGVLTCPPSFATAAAPDPATP